MSKSGVAPEILTLPDGGGAITPIGDRFEPDIYTGTGQFRVPLWFPKGVRGFGPTINLIYSTGLGAGAFGFGWRLDLLSIRRQIDRRLPTYDAQDRFTLGGEELVPVGGGVYQARTNPFLITVRRLGPRWELRDRDGNLFRLGDTDGARQVVDRGAGPETFAWFVHEAVDPFGNTISYEYEHDAGEIYLASISYARFQVLFSYAARPDVLTDHHSGVPIATRRRCTRIEYHLSGDADPLMRAYDFSYTQADGAGHSLLSEIVYSGRRPGLAGAEAAEMPRLRFSYAPFAPVRPRLRALNANGTAPPPLDQPDVALVDVFARGLPDVVELGINAGRYWPNAGRGQFGPPHQLARFPATLALSQSGVAFADMDGSATADVVDLGQRPAGYYPNQPGEGWQLLSPTRQPGLDFNNPNLRLLDLDGDHVTDALLTGEQYFFLFFNRVAKGWDEPIRVRRTRDLAAWPDVFFADPRVKLADMDGDGLIDIVLVNSGRIDYWPALGYGRWGARVSLDLTPHIGSNFDPARLFLTDLDGDGAADVVYVEGTSISCWINRCGRELSEMILIRHTPPLGSAVVTPVDMNGSGTAGILWSSDHSALKRHNYTYLDLTRDEKPYLLRRIDNGMGLTTEIEYRSSVEYYLDDLAAHSQWSTSLPFPVTTVSAITQRDAVTGIEQRRTYTYHDGLFDGQSREFRGFGRVEAIELGDDTVPTSRTVSFFHQGRPVPHAPLSPEQAHALAGKLYRLETYALDNSAQEAMSFRIDVSDWGVQQVATGLDGRLVLFPFLAKTVAQSTERGPAMRQGQILMQYDLQGNIIQKEEVSVNEDGSDERVIARMTYAVDPAGIVRGKPAEILVEDGDGHILSLRRFYYDGPAHQGLALGQFVHGLVSRQEDLVLSPPAIAVAYGAAPPDFAALGYHSLALPDGSSGWAANTAGRAYNAQGNLIATSDADGNITTIVYDADHLHPIEIHQPAGQVFGVQYDIRAQAVGALTDPNGQTSAYQFDPFGHTSAVIKPGDTAEMPTITIHYHPETMPTSMTMETRTTSGQPATARSVRYFDGFGRTRQQRTEAEGGQVLIETETIRNRRGLVAQSIRPFFDTGFDYADVHGPAAIQYRYDGLGRQIGTIMADGTSTHTSYDLFSITRYDATDTDDSPENKARGHFDTPKIERLGGSGGITSVTEQVDGAQITTSYEYSAAGHLTRIVDARGINLVTYVYDHLGRKIRITHSDAGDRIFWYTARGTLAGSKEPLGHTIAYAHDAANRLTTVSIDGAVVERRFYDNGPGTNLKLRLARVEDEAGEVSFSYDARGMLLTKTRTVPTQSGNQVFTLSYVYDARENLVDLTYPDGATVHYQFSPRGLLSAIDGFVDSIGYNALGQITSIHYANGVQSENQYETANALLQQARIFSAGTDYSSYSFTYDAIGDPLTIADNLSGAVHQRFERAFSYDALHRLTGATGQVGATPFAHEYTYDSVGNLSRNTEYLAGDLSIDSASNRIEGVSNAGTTTTLFTYDAAGNMVTLPGLALTFDARSRLVAAQKADGTQIEYRYSYEGARVIKHITQGGLTHEHISIDGLYEWQDGVITRHITDGIRRYALVRGGTTSFVHTDNLGSATLFTAADGTLLFQAGYFAYGSAAFRAVGDTEAHRYVQQYLDEETGLYYFHARYFHPGLGRFISPDPAVLGSPDNFLQVPQGLNPYAYALNNPVRLVDVNGNWWKWIVGGLIIAALAVLTIVTYGAASPALAAAFPLVASAFFGAVIGGAIGITHAAVSGQSLSDGFLFGVIVGGAAGALGYWAGTATAGAIGGVWGQIIGQAVQGAIVGFGDGLIQGFASGKGVLETLESAFIGAAIGAAVGFATEGLGQWMQTSSVSWIHWIGKTLLSAGERWWWYWTSLLRPIPKAWAFEKVSNWISGEDTRTSSSALSSYDSSAAALAAPHNYTTATPVSIGAFFGTVDDFLQGALNVFLTNARSDVAAAMA